MHVSLQAHRLGLELTTLDSSYLNGVSDPVHRFVRALGVSLPSTAAEQLDNQTSI